MKGQDSIPVTISDFSGGEADLPFTMFPTKYSANMINVYPNLNGGISFCPGYQRVNSVAVSERLYSGHVYIKKDGTKIVLVAGEGKVYKVSAGALVSIKTGLNTSAIVRFVTANNICVFYNGVDAPQKYDGTTVSALGGTPPSTAFKGVYHRGRLWLIERTDKMLASHSALQNIEDYTTAHNAGYLDFTKQLKSGDELTDIESYMDLLVFYFKNHVVVYSGTNPTDYGDFQIVSNTEGAGALTGSVCGIGIDHFFLSQVGARSLRRLMQTQATTEGLLSEKIASRIAAAVAGQGSSGIYASAHFQRLGWYMLLIGDTIHCLSYTGRSAWFRIVPNNIFGLFSDADGSTVYLCGNGYLYQFDIGYLFDGAAPLRQWNGPWIKLFRNQERGYPKWAEIYSYQVSPITAKMFARYDMNIPIEDSEEEFTLSAAPTLMDEPVYGIWDDYFFMDPEEYSPTRIPLFGGGISMQPNFSSQDSDGPCDINNIKISYVAGGN